MSVPKNKKVIGELNLEIGKFKFYDNILIGEINEGINMEFKNFLKLMNLIKEIYDDKPIVYISNRVNSYSIDPIGYRNALKFFPKIIGYSVVTNKKPVLSSIAIEKRFFKSEVLVFKDMELAVNWAKIILN